MYGATATESFRYYDLNIAEGITTTGQIFNKFAQEVLNGILNKESGTDGVDYIFMGDTDSVPGWTKVIINGSEVRIDSLMDQDGVLVKNDTVKEDYVKLLECKTTPVLINGKIEERAVKYVMKHKVKKRMYRITTPDGKTVEMTNDHSMVVRRNGDLVDVKPADILPDDMIVSINPVA